MRKKLILGVVISFFSGMLCLAVIGIGQQQSSVQKVDQTDPGRAAGAQSSDAVTEGSAKIPKADFVVSTDSASTTSVDYVDMAGMTKTFKLAGLTKEEVIVMFQAEWSGGSDRALIRLLVDGLVQPGPGEDAQPFAPHEGSEVSTNGFNFVTPPISPGTHTVTIQWASVGGAGISVDERTMIILHK